MYGLKQATKLAWNQLVKCLEIKGYKPDKFSPNTWSHHKRKSKFYHCVDDFGIKYYNKEDANHLLSILTYNYDISVDCNGNNYCGLKLDWNYQKQYVDISIPGYVAKGLRRFQNIKKKGQYSSHEYAKPFYGKKTQYASSPGQPKKMDSKGII